MSKLSSSTQQPFPPSLWTATAPKAYDFRPLQSEEYADVCIIGAGFTGLSAALHLAERGSNVVIVDAVGPGWGASGRNGGQIIPGLKISPSQMQQRFGTEQGEKLASFSGDAPDLVFDLIERHHIDCHAERSGWLRALHSPKVRSNVENDAKEWQDLGAPVEMLDQTATHDLIGSDKYAGAMLDKRGGKLQPLAYARGLARAAIQKGVRIHDHSRILQVRRRQKSWYVASKQGAVLADQVLLCTNGYTDTLWPNLEKSIVPAFSYQVATKTLPEDILSTILPGGQVVSDTRRLLWYFRTDDSGRLLIG